MSVAMNYYKDKSAKYKSEMDGRNYIYVGESEDRESLVFKGLGGNQLRVSTRLILGSDSNIAETEKSVGLFKIHQN